MHRKGLNLTFLFNAADAGAGGGASGGGGTGTGGGAATGGTGGAGGTTAGSGASGGGAPIRLSADAMVDLGDGRPVKFGDYQKQYIPRTELPNHIKTAQQQWLQGLRTMSQQAGQHRQQAEPQTDPFAEIADLPIIDGRTLAEVARKGIGPLQKLVVAQNNALRNVQQQLQQLTQGHGTVQERFSAQDFGARKQDALKTLGEEWTPFLNDPVLQEYADDVYLSYDPNDQTLNSEYPKLLKQRLDGLINLVRKIDQAKLEAAKEKRRNWMRPGGQGQPGKEQPWRPKNNNDAARALFHGVEAST